MKSVFQRALGPAYDTLHPELQRRYGLTSHDDRRCVGRGRMRSIRRNPLTLPVLWAGARRNLLFPETGTDVPFEVRTHPFNDAGVETVAYIRAFEVGPGRRFDAYMHYDADRDCVIDALGTHRTLVTELRFEATDSGGLRIETGDQWAVVGDRTVPIPTSLRADVRVKERYDDDRDRFEIAVVVSNPVVGRVFAYDGWFTVEYEPYSELPPEDTPADWSR